MGAPAWLLRTLARSIPPPARSTVLLARSTMPPAKSGGPAVAPSAPASGTRSTMVNALSPPWLPMKRSSSAGVVAAPILGTCILDEYCQNVAFVHGAGIVAQVVEATLA